MTTWYFERTANNQWHLHAEGYTPEVSFKVAQRHDGQVISAFHKDTTLPQGIKEILTKMVPHLNLYGDHLHGYTRVEINREQVEQAARNVERLYLLLEQKKKEKEKI